MRQSTVFILILILNSFCNPKESSNQLPFRVGLPECSIIIETNLEDSLILHPSNNYSIKLPKDWVYYINIDVFNGISASDSMADFEEKTGRILKLRTISITENESIDTPLVDLHKIELKNFTNDFPNVIPITTGSATIQDKECMWLLYRTKEDTLGNFHALSYLFKSNDRNISYVVETGYFGDGDWHSELCSLRYYINTFDFK
jgi:hypothetical protein